MEILSVGNMGNSPNFGVSSVRFVDISLKNRVVETPYKQAANTLLDKLAAYYPEKALVIGTMIDASKGPVIYAKDAKTNSRLGYITERAPIDAQNNIGDSKSFYRLIGTLLNPHLLMHKGFWQGNSLEFPKPIPNITSTSIDSPLEHKIFA